MESHGRCTSFRSKIPPENRRRLIMFPLPFQGHINPMLQLADILHTNGFKISIIHTEFNAPNYSNYPHFTFKSFPEGFSDVINRKPRNPDISFYLTCLNEMCVDPFRDCLSGLLTESPVACLISDAGWYITTAVADSLKLPRMVLRTSSLASVPVYGSILSLHEKGYFNLSKQDPRYESPVPEFPRLKMKDIVRMSLVNPQGMGEYWAKMFKEMKASSGLIWNTFKELEELELETIRHDFPVPSFTLGPFHKYFPEPSGNLIEPDRTIIPWLDAQAPRSVIYVSFGSVARIHESEFQEVAHGLAKSGLPFLWVVRPGLVHGSEWLEPLPDKFLEKAGDWGRIVKWAPQQEVLAHPSTGCFWTHNGWNSTLESICEGVPMICSPCFVDQSINARYVSDVWKIGVMLEDGFERMGIEKLIKKVMTDKEGEEIRERINRLREKLNISLDQGGSSHDSLKSFIDYITLF